MAVKANHQANHIPCIKVLDVVCFAAELHTLLPLSIVLPARSVVEHAVQPLHRCVRVSTLRRVGVGHVSAVAQRFVKGHTMHNW
jgi:hypothetical protein